MNGNVTKRLFAGACAALALVALTSIPLLRMSPPVRAEGKPRSASGAVPGRYQIVSDQGTLFFLDTSSGRMWLYHEDEGSWKPFPTPIVP